jgi:ferrous-iron efflux pump FieF
VTERTARLMRNAAFASLAISVVLVAIKTVAYFLSSSVSILASLADSALDLFTSTLNLVAIHSALTPADADHRFGHGKAEPLAGLAQGAFIAGSATFLIVQAVNRLIAPEPIAHGIVAYQRYVVKETGSLAIGADKLHYTGDLITNAGVILAIVLAWGLGWTLADPIIALFVAAALIWTAWGVFHPSYDQLMDRELADENRDAISRIVLAHPEVRALHDLRTRAAGTRHFIQLHIELDPAMTLTRAHEVSDEVERELCKAFPAAEVIIHQDPAGLETPEK